MTTPIQAKTPSVATKPISRGRPLEIVQKEIDKLSKEQTASYSAPAKVRFVAFFALASFGAVYSLWMLFAEAWNTWYYLAAVGALGIGGLANKSFHSHRVERNKNLTELKDCQKALMEGSWAPFSRHLRSSGRDAFSIPELLNIYRLFKESTKALAAQ